MKKTKKRLQLVFTILVLLVSEDCFASPQMPDYVIYKEDTIPIYNLILEQYFQKKGKSDNGSLFGLKFRENASLNCWRGYQAIYLIENDSLFLKNVISCGERIIDEKASNQRISQIFNDKVKNNKVYVDWFSDDLSLPNGELLRWDGVFHKTFENEISIKIQNGKIKSTSEIQNYIDDPHRVDRKYDDSISNILFRELSKSNWKNEKEFDCSEKYLVTINKNGKVSDVAMTEYKTSKEIKEFWDRNEYNYCVKTMLNNLQGLKFDILKMNGKPIEEKVYIEIWVEDDGKLENWTD